MRRRMGLLTAILVLAVLGPWPSVEAAVTLTRITCGMTIDKSIVVANSLFNCPESALAVIAGDITIDLNGHIVDGNSTDDDLLNTEAGINNVAGHSDVRVINGYISDFEVGVLVKATPPAVLAANNEMEDLVFAGNGWGVYLWDAVGAQIEGVSALGNSFGMQLQGGSEHTLDQVDASGNANSGVLIVDGSDHTIQNSTASGNGIDGYQIVGAPGSGHKIKKSSASGNAFRGVLISEGSNYVLESVDAWGNAMQGVLLAHGTGHTIKKATLTGNQGDGAVFSGASGSQNAIVKSVVAGNGDDGVDVQAGDQPVVSGNKVYRNGFSNGIGDPSGLGIRIGGGVTNLDADKNKAGENDEDAAQCSAAANCTAFTPPEGTIVQCGLDVNSSITVGNSLFDCTHSGLEIKADNVELDLTGFLIDGNFNNDDGSLLESGVDNVEGHSGLEVIGGLVSDFEAGVYINGAGATANLVEATQAASNLRGFFLESASGVVLDGISAWASPTGIRIEGGTGGHEIENALTWGNASFGGIRIFVSANDVVTGSRSFFNATDGIHVIASPGTVIEDTLVAANDDNGIELESSQVQTEKVTALGNGLNGIETVSGDSENVINKSKAFGNGNAGISLGGNDNAVLKSETSRNSRRGLYITGSDHMISGIKANSNGYENGVADANGFGVEVVSAPNLIATKVKAALNDADTMQCSVEANCNA